MALSWEWFWFYYFKFSEVNGAVPPAVKSPAAFLKSVEKYEIEVRHLVEILRNCRSKVLRADRDVFKKIGHLREERARNKPGPPIKPVREGRSVGYYQPIFRQEARFESLCSWFLRGSNPNAKKLNER